MTNTLRQGIAAIAQTVNEQAPRMTGAELRRWRKAHRLTQEQTAEWLEVSRRWLIRRENGERPVERWLAIIVGLMPLPSAARFQGRPNTG